MVQLLGYRALVLVTLVMVVCVQVMVYRVFHITPQRALFEGQCPRTKWTRTFIPINNTRLLQSRDLQVFFGKNKARIIRVEKNGIDCQVPPSDYEGIGWNTTVRVKVCASAACDDDAINMTWTYPATRPATCVANVGLMWLTNESPLAVKVIELFVNRLGPTWRFQFMMFPGVAAFYLNTTLFQQLQDEGRLVYETIEKHTRRQYALKCVDPAYWEKVQGDRVLVFQEDSVPCSHSLQNITDFFDYDYIGAPWSWYPYVGNGGLSLRNRTALIRLLKENKEVVVNQSSNRKWYMEDYTIGLFKFCFSWRILSCFGSCAVLHLCLFARQVTLAQPRPSSAWHRAMLPYISAQSGTIPQGHGVHTKCGEDSRKRNSATCCSRTAQSCHSSATGSLKASWNQFHWIVQCLVSLSFASTFCGLFSL